MSGHHDDMHTHDACCAAHEGNPAAVSKVQRAEESIINKEWITASISFVLLGAGLVLDYWIAPGWFSGVIRAGWYAVAYIPVGIPVLLKGIRLAWRGDVFTEFILMSIATIGAFYIGEYPEGVAVMLFYAVGELFQDAAVNRAKRSIKALLDVRPDTANALRNGTYVSVDPSDVKIDETIRVKVGERVPLDGEMLSNGSSFNTAALTGESKPVSIEKGEAVLAGMINEEKVTEIKVTKLFGDSSLARILTLVQNATGRKARTELFIRRFARIYTPVVVFLAFGLTLLPYFFVENYVFNDWLYRALIFLVISCPCALVVAIPLGYFGGIGAGSRNGILFKGSNYLDVMTRVDTIVMDKTGTLTKGVFRVQQVISSLPENEWIPLVAAVESHSTHPAGKAIIDYAGGVHKNIAIGSIEEIKGHGLKGIVNGKEVLAGNARLLTKFNISFPAEAHEAVDTLVLVAVDKQYAGYITIADELKPDSQQAIVQMHAANLKTIMLSGDKQAVADQVARALGIDEAYGDLLPEDKVKKIEEIKSGKKEPVAFVGDGINDAPVLALSDVGIAMGGLGSDAAIETADIVIQTDQPSKIVTAIKIGKATNAVVWQNIAFAFGVKLIVLALGAGGVATLWEAVFADVGVALLAILNAIRIQHMRFS
ncbi:MAG: cadmium-translocating P-type ATPase [Cyclobacteriaceae bacterium]|nr:cadmium-translocating P-type ATPase [Cyclobacteriaceae bacterium]